MNNLNSILELYKGGHNIIKVLTEQFSDQFDKDEIIQISYAIQADAYTQKALAAPELERERGSVFASVLDGIDGITSMLEAGVGEGRHCPQLLVN
jgi:hypothetical protein